MRLVVSVCGLVILAACSGSGDLPLGGPFGVGQLDGGAGSGTGTGTGSGTATGPIFVPSSTGTGFTSATTSSATTESSESSSSEVSSTTSETSSSTTTSTTTSTSSTSTTSTTSSSSSSGAPTWTYLYNTYLAVGTEGDCDSSSCHHHTQCSSASACFNWIGGRQLSGGGGLLSWDNGYMPPSEPQDATAEAAFTAWTAAGAQDN